ncbi:uncharacterized protein LOC142987831 [Anticarsia gemmatalis]|uniref:uncharacterized protein LOC142987831 n=1 Tax=Anticarsia gemmatalis TaxID=129554 RepID=UPI003F76D429
MLQYIHQQQDHSYRDFNHFCQDTQSEKVIDSVAEATKDQADSKLWHSMCQGRVTGSRLYEAVHCQTGNDVLVQSILGGYKVISAKFVLEIKCPISGKTIKNYVKNGKLQG